MTSRHKKYQQELGKKILECYDKGVTLKATAQKLGVAKSTVYYHAKRLGTSFIKKERLPRKFAREQLRSLHSFGLTKKEIARILGASEKTVYVQAKRMNLTFIDRIPERKFTDEQLIDLCKRGLTRNKQRKNLVLALTPLITIENC